MWSRKRKAISKKDSLRDSSLEQAKEGVGERKDSASFSSRRVGGGLHYLTVDQMMSPTTTPAMANTTIRMQIFFRELR